VDARQARRQQILDAALALADERGLGAVSMRAVAERVGVTPMALYPYVGNKEALLDGLVDRLLASLLPFGRGEGDWRGRLREGGRTARALARRHPSAYPLLFSRPSVTPDAVRVVDAIYTLLLEAGVPPREVPRLERLLSTFVLGYATSEVNGRFGEGTLNPRSRRAQFPAGEVPAHRRLAKWLDEPVDWDAEFEADLDNLIGLVERMASRGPGRPRRDTSTTGG
jgi:AcrR family transcriptional regulator